MNVYIPRNTNLSRLNHDVENPNRPVMKYKSFIKTKCHNTNFSKAGDTYNLIKMDKGLN